MNVVNYTNYFRQMAVRHSQLRHNPLSETGDVAIGEKHFAKYGAEEVLSSLRTKVSWPALLIEMYEIKTTAEVVFSITGNYYGAFSVFATANPESMIEQEAAYQLCEKIMGDVLAQIYQDHYGPNVTGCDTPFKFFDVGSLNIVPVGPVFDRQFGWRCEFEFNPHNPLNITTAPAPGTFV